LDAAIKKNEERVSTNDRSLLRMLCYGTLRYHWTLQEWIDQLVARPLRKQDRVVNALLAVGLYQIVEMRIPDHAVVSETVEAARRLRRPKLAGLVNACLRRFVREDLSSKDPLGDESKWNHPGWLIKRFRTDWPDDWEAILPDAVRLKEPQAVDKLPGFAAGDASVQDAAAQIAARWLLQGVTGRVLDACAAPGGKSGHLLEIGGDGISLVCVDSDESRTQSIADNLARIDRNATIIAADASKPKEWWDDEPFDAILLDAPCSASGVIRRHPDIKLLRRESDLTSLTALQRELLEALWPTLAPGGTLLYATCSVLAAENDEVTEQFLADHGDAIENDVLPNNNIRDLMRRKGCGYQILPGSAGMDGFYYAALQKKKVS